METIDNKTPLDQARELVMCLEAGDQVEAEKIIRGLCPCNDHELFQEVGRLTRELHEAIHGFLLDDRITQLAQQEIPDATERLKYVISMTEQAANTTLSAVENSLPLTEELGKEAASLGAEWKRFRDRELSVDEFRTLSANIGRYLTATDNRSKELHDMLSEVLMAQGFQDLTGQIIRRVIEMVKDVEEKLVKLVSIAGQHQLAATPERKLEGPAVPGIDQGEQVGSQDEVDDLLSSLGF